MLSECSYNFLKYFFRFLSVCIILLYRHNYFFRFLLNKKTCLLKDGLLERGYSFLLFPKRHILPYILPKPVNTPMNEINSFYNMGKSEGATSAGVKAFLHNLLYENFILYIFNSMYSVINYKLAVGLVCF